MLTEIRATNFKSWIRLKPDAPASAAAPIDAPGLPLGKVTGLFGANSSGKTSILQVLLLLKQTAESADRGSPLDFGDLRSPIRLGTFSDILRDHDLTASLGLGLRWSVSEPLDIRDPENPDNLSFTASDFSFSTEIASRQGAMEVTSFTYEAGDETSVHFRRIEDGRSRYELIARVSGDSDYLKRTPRRILDFPAPVKCYGFPDEVNAFFQNAGFVSDLELSLEEQLRGIYYLGPLRDVPQPFYAWTGATPADVGYNGANAIPALLAAQKSRERGNFRKRGSLANKEVITVEQHVAEWLQELGLVNSFRVAPVAEGADIYRAYVKRYESSPEVLLTDIGFGVSQVLPVLVLLAYVPEGSTVILEQPEIHLHPAVQSSLADVILEAALVRNVQVVVESHSEHLLRRIQLRIAEQHLENGTPVSADDVRLWFIDQDGPVSRANDLKINEYGEIMNWPKDFFGDRLRETARIAKAGLRRRDAAQS